jgi:NitT/TauT family transport system substrate-binding protein
MSAGVVVPLESRSLRRALRAVRTGSAVIAVEDGYGAATASAADVFRAASSPPGRILVRVAHARNLYDTIVRRRRFSVNVLEKPHADGTCLLPASLVAGAQPPRVVSATAFLDCELEWVEPFDEGAVFVGRVRGAAVGTGPVDAQPLVAEFPFAPFAMRRTGSEARPLLRVATTPNDSGAQVYYARDRGFFEKAGVDVDIVQMSSGGMIALGVSSGLVDVASCGVSSVASAYERGIDFVIVAPGSLWNRRTISSALVVAADSPVRRAQDLNGKIVAVNGLLTVMQLSIQAWMARNGADASTVNFVECPLSGMADAVRGHEVDAAFIAQPFLDAAVKAGTRILSAPYGAIAAEFMINGWFTTRTFARANDNALRRFDIAMGEAARWANAHQHLSLAILARARRLCYGARPDAHSALDRRIRAIQEPAHAISGLGDYRRTLGTDSVAGHALYI